MFAIRLNRYQRLLNCALPSFSLALVSFDSRVFTACLESRRTLELAVDLCFASVIRYIVETLHRKSFPNLDSRISILGAAAFLLRKEVIQPQVPLRLPCYDFIPVTAHSVDGYLLLPG